MLFLPDLTVPYSPVINHYLNMKTFRLEIDAGLWQCNVSSIEEKIIDNPIFPKKS